MTTLHGPGMIRRSIFLGIDFPLWICRENRVYSQWNSYLIGIMISKTIGFRGTLFSDTPLWICRETHVFFFPHEIWGLTIHWNDHEMRCFCPANVPQTSPNPATICESRGFHCRGAAWAKTGWRRTYLSHSVGKKNVSKPVNNTI